MENIIALSSSLSKAREADKLRLQSTLRKACADYLTEEEGKGAGVVRKEEEEVNRRRVENLLWEACFYSRIVELRMKIKAAARTAEAGTTGKNTDGKSGARRNQKKEEQRERWSRLTASFRKFLEEGVYFYNSLAEGIQRRHGGGEGGGGGGETAVSSRCYKCYMALGDLTRYSIEVGSEDLGCENWTVPSQYYQLSTSLRPDIGNAFNQLAVLARHVEDASLAIYYYYRSLAVENAFMSSRGNLILLYETNRLHYHEYKKEDAEALRAHKNSARGNNNNRKRDRRRGGRGRGRRRQQQNNNDNNSAVEKTDDAILEEVAVTLSMDDEAALRELRTRFVRLHGIIFTKTSLELFSECLSFFLKKLRLALGRSTLSEHLRGTRCTGFEANCSIVFQMAIDGIFAVHNVAYVPDGHQGGGGGLGNNPSDNVRREVLYRNAFDMLFGIFALLIGKVLVEEDRSWHSPIAVPVWILLEWLSQHPRFVQVGLNCDASGPFWEAVATLLNKPMQYTAQGGFSIPEDEKLVGFQPINQEALRSLTKQTPTNDSTIAAEQRSSRAYRSTMYISQTVPEAIVHDALRGFCIPSRLLAEEAMEEEEAEEEEEEEEEEMHNRELAETSLPLAASQKEFVVQPPPPPRVQEKPTFESDFGLPSEFPIDTTLIDSSTFLRELVEQNPFKTK